MLGFAPSPQRLSLPRHSCAGIRKQLIIGQHAVEHSEFGCIILGLAQIRRAALNLAILIRPFEGLVL